MTKTLTCYRGAVQALSEYIFDPDSGRVIDKKDDGSVVSAEQIPKDPRSQCIYEMYKNFGEVIQVSESGFNTLYKNCREIKRLQKETKSLATKLFEQN